MANLVQSAHASVVSNPVVSKAFNSDNALHNTLFANVGIWFFSHSMTVVVNDTQGNIWNAISSSSQTNDSIALMFRADDVKAGPNIITATITAADNSTSQDQDLTILEVAGLGSAPVTDFIKQTQGNGGSPFSLSLTGDTSALGSYLLAFCFDQTNGNDVFSITAGTFALEEQTSNPDGQSGGTFDHVAGAAGTYPVTIQIDHGTNLMHLIYGAFKAQAPSLVSIAVTPANPTIVAGVTQQFVATGTYSDASTADITGTVTWASATPGTATIAAGGLATGVAAGTSLITATLGVVGSTTLTVTTSIVLTEQTTGLHFSANFTGLLSILDPVTGNVRLEKFPVSENFVGSIVNCAENFLVGVTPTTLSLPALPTQWIFLKNLSTVNTVTVTWRPTGGTSNQVIKLQPESGIILMESNTTSGITALSVQASGANTPIDALLIA